MTLPVLASSATNQSGTAVTTATFTRPTATGGALVDDLLIAVLNLESTVATAAVAFQAVFPLNYYFHDYSDGRMYVGMRRAAAGDPATWPITIGSSAYQSAVLAYRNVTWLMDRAGRLNTASLTITDVADLDVGASGFDVLPTRIICMDQEAAARTLTPGAGLTSVFNSEEPTTFLRTVVLHGAQQDVEVIPLPQINSTLSVVEAHAIMAFTLAGVAYPSNKVVADGSTALDPITSLPLLTGFKMGDPPISGGAQVPITGQLWPRGVG